MRFLQYFIGLILVATSIGKLLDIQGFAQIIESYEIFSGFITAPLGLFLALAELGLAIWLFSGIKLDWSALTTAGLHIGFAGWSTLAILRGLEIANCGCFGVFFALPLGLSTIILELIMVSLSITLYFLAKKYYKKSRKRFLIF